MHAHASGMRGITRESVSEDIRELLSNEEPKGRLELIEELKKVIQRELMRIHIDVPDMECPACGCGESIRYGKTRKGTQRWKCCGCGSVRCHRDTGSILATTKLDDSVWMEYAVCFADRLTCDEVAERLGVCHKTAWFMRLRVLQGLFPNLPSFQVKAGTGTELDELYFRESFKGNRFDRMSFRPREPYKDTGGGRRGISNEKICVMTAFNDAGDFFFDVSCRGALTNRVAMSVLEDRICEGSIVNTDDHRVYPKVMDELQVASHSVTSARNHGGLQRINEIHGDVRAFLARFKGVSTRWLHLYLGWYKWIRVYGKNPDTVAKQIIWADYTNTWDSLKSLGSPFRDDFMNPMKC